MDGNSASTTPVSSPTRPQSKSAPVKWDVVVDADKPVKEYLTTKYPCQIARYDYDLWTNVALAPECINAFPQSIFNTILVHRWKNYMIPCYKLCVFQSEANLYEHCIKHKLLCFAYARIMYNSKVYIYLKVIESRHQDIGNHMDICGIDAFLLDEVPPALKNFPMRIWKPKRFAIYLDVNTRLCTSCSTGAPTILNLNYICCNPSCHSYKQPNLQTLLVYNFCESVLFTPEEMLIDKAESIHNEKLLYDTDEYACVQGMSKVRGSGIIDMECRNKSALYRSHVKRKRNVPIIDRSSLIKRIITKKPRIQC